MKKFSSISVKTITTYHGKDLLNRLVLGSFHCYVGTGYWLYPCTKKRKAICCYLSL